MRQLPSQEITSVEGDVGLRGWFQDGRVSSLGQEML